MGDEVREYLVGLDVLWQQRCALCVVEGEEGGSDEHEQRPDGYRHQYTDIGGLLSFLVVLGSQVALYDGLVGAILLQRVEDTVEHHHDKRQLGQIPVIGSETDLVVFRCDAEGLSGSAVNTK